MAFRFANTRNFFDGTAYLVGDIAEAVLKLPYGSFA